jgi:Cu/Ag efflux pump CusA
VYQQVQVEGIELTFGAYQKVHNYKGESFRLSPILITATDTSLGLVPTLLSKGSGIFTSTLLTLLILPLVYEKFGVKIEKNEGQR